MISGYFSRSNNFDQITFEYGRNSCLSWRFGDEHANHRHILFRTVRHGDDLRYRHELNLMPQANLVYGKHFRSPCPRLRPTNPTKASSCVTATARYFPMHSRDM
jgi:hypothetical protein